MLIRPFLVLAIFELLIALLLPASFSRAEDSALPDDEVVAFILGINEAKAPVTKFHKEPHETEKPGLGTSQEQKSQSEDRNRMEGSRVIEEEREETVSELSDEKDVSEGLSVLGRKPAEDVPPETKPPERQGERERRFFGPLPTRNLHPLYLPFFNFRADVASTLQPGQSAFSANIEGANTIIKEIEGGAIVDLDHESWLYSFEYARGLEGGEIEIFLPLVMNSHGVMDSIIDLWHRFWSLPRGKRPIYPSDDYRFYVRTRNGDIFNFPSDKFGLGDISLGWKGELAKSRTGRRYLSYGVALKLPTGNDDSGTGSGGTDFGVRLLWQNEDGRFAYYANANYVWLGEGGLSGLADDSILGWMLAGEYSLRPSVTLCGQVNFSESPFRTGSPDADRDSYELWIGFHRMVKDRFIFSGGFSEDINPETAPDFAIIANLKWLL